MREQCLFSLEKKWQLVGDLISIFNYLTGGLQRRWSQALLNEYEQKDKKQWAQLAVREILIRQEENIPRHESSKHGINLPRLTGKGMKLDQKSSQETYLQFWPCLEQEVRWESSRCPMHPKLLFSSKKSLWRNTEQGILPSSLQHSAPVQW